MAVPQIRRAVWANSLRTAPTLNPIQRLLLVRRTVWLVFCSYVDMLLLPSTKPAELCERFEIVGTEHLDAILARGEGGIMAVPHIGSWSAALAALSERGYALVLIVEPIQPPELLEMITGLRKSHGLEVLPLGPDAGRAMIRAMKSNQIVILAGDRALASQAIQMPFFGESAPVPSGPGALAARGMPVVTAFAAWLDYSHGMLGIEPMPSLKRRPDESAAEATHRATKELLERFELYIQAFPANWGVLQSVWETGINHERD